MPARHNGPVSSSVRHNTKTSSRYLVGDHLLSKSNKCTTVVTGRPSAGGRRTDGSPLTGTPTVACLRWVTVHAGSGRPSAGGRRTSLPFDQLRTSTVSSAPAGTVPRCRWYPEIAHPNSGSGRPSAGGRRTVSSRSACTITTVCFRTPPPRTGISKLATQVFRRQFSNQVSLLVVVKSLTRHSSGPPTAAA